MSITTNMLLSLPTVSTTIGPSWATQVNEAFETIDAHDHSSDKGARITPAGMSINANLNIDNNIFYNFKSVRLQSQSAALSGASYANGIHSVNGDLYFTNGSGTAIQLTDGGSIISTPSSASVFETEAISTDVTINDGDTYVFLRVDTSAAREITLPLAANVGDGRFYIVKDITGSSESYNITVTVQGSDTIDGATSFVLSSNYSSVIITSDGASAWYVS